MQKIFSSVHEDGTKLRLTQRGNTFWYSAKDVCDMLGIDDVSKALRGVAPKEKMSIAVSGGKKMHMVNALGLRFLACRPELRARVLWADSLCLVPQDESSASDDGYLTVAEYADKQGYVLINSESSRVAKLIVRRCRDRGLPIHQREHGIFGTINSYPEEIIKEIFYEEDVL